jgi:hypothetical protein
MSKKEKKLNISVVEREHEPGLYKMLDGLVRKHHEDLRDAEIVIAWRFGWTADVDGRLVLGQMKKASDLDRKLHGYDFVVLLNFEAWTAADFTDDQKRALLDHELCHGALALDEDGETQHDVEGHKVYRTRKHSIEEFVEVVERHGLWTSELERFAEAAVKKKRHPLLVALGDDTAVAAGGR